MLVAEIPGQGRVEMTFQFEPADDGMWSATFSSNVFTGTGIGVFDEGTGEFELTLTVENGPIVVITGRVDGDILKGVTDAPNGNVPVKGRRILDEDAEAKDEEDSEEEEEEEADPAFDPKRWHDAIEFTVEPVISSGLNDSQVTPSPDGTKIVAVGDGRGRLAKCFSWDGGSNFGEFDGLSKKVNSCDFRPTKPFR